MDSTNALRPTKSLDKLNIFRSLRGKDRKSKSASKVPSVSDFGGMRHDPGQPKQLKDQCCVCDSGLTFSAGASCFRCTVCDTTNDLKPQTRHEPCTPLDFKDLEELESIYGDKSDPHDRLELSERLKKRFSLVFGQARLLNDSFLNKTEFSNADCGVDLSVVRRMYRLVSRHTSLMQVVLQATESLLSRPGKKVRDAKDSRFLLILLENPSLKPQRHKNTDTSSQSILAKLLGLISSLPTGVHQFMVNWLGRYPSEVFLQRLELLNSFLSGRMRKLERDPARKYSTCWQVRAASRTMAIMFTANTVRIKAPISSFYIGSDDFIDLDADYLAWKNKRDQYSLCQYPFLITLRQKQKILAIDAYRQMRLKQREAYFNLLDGKVEEAVFRLRIRRSHLLEDSLAVISQNEDQFKKKLIVEFVREEGVDIGGLRKEYFLLLCRRFFDPHLGLFIEDEDSRQSWFDPSANDHQHVSMYYLLGVTLGLAIYNSVLLDVNFPPVLFKKLLGQPCGLSDLKDLHPRLTDGLQQLLTFEGDVENVICRNFVLDETVRGIVRSVPLCPNGEAVPVTNGNRKKFVHAYVQHILETSCSRSMFHVSRGFHQVAGGNALSLLAAEEIELLVRGSPEPLDIEDLKSVCTYDGFPNAKYESLVEPVVANFWHVFQHMGSTEQRALLAFVTGSDRVPATGTGDLRFRISVDCSAELDRLPIAHTCFSQIVLPRYETLQELEKKLGLAVREGSSGFTIA